MKIEAWIAEKASSPQFHKALQKGLTEGEHTLTKKDKHVLGMSPDFRLPLENDKGRTFAQLIDLLNKHFKRRNK